MYRSTPIIPVQNQKVDTSCNTLNGCVKKYIWNVPNDNIYKNKSGCDNGQRSRKTIIRSGMQENKKPYSFSYHEHMKNKRLMTYEKNIASEKPWVNNKTTSKVKSGNCNIPCRTITTKSNNKKFCSFGAVSSSSRLDRLKLDTIRDESKCGAGEKSNISGRRCNGVYAGNKIRFLGHRTYNLGNCAKCNVETEQDRARRRARGR